MKRKYKRESNNESKIKVVNFINKILILVCSFLSIITIDKANEDLNLLSNFKYVVNEHSDWILVAQKYFKDPIYTTDDSVTVDKDMSKYENTEIIDNGLLVRNEFNETIFNVSDGIVVEKTSTQLVVKGLDGYEYIYTNFFDLNVTLYQYVREDEVIGLSIYNDNSSNFEYEIKIKSKNIYLDVKEVIGID